MERWPRSWVRIVAPHFVAGAKLTNGLVTEVAPIIHYMRGWSIDRVATYVKRKRWSAEEFEE